uniref:Invertebrate defensins family profile domain-containing protein n=1 Tax=Parastrongyloides trichosuri TaxID=131310 RepID=A0A0N4ZKX3_PARTI
MINKVLLVLFLLTICLTSVSSKRNCHKVTYTDSKCNTYCRNSGYTLGFCDWRNFKLSAPCLCRSGSTGQVAGGANPMGQMAGGVNPMGQMAGGANPMYPM